MVTYEIVRETRRRLGKWAIRVIVDGVAQEGTIGAGYETKADAQYWVEQLTTPDEVDA
jgi:hypothetical protein